MTDPQVKETLAKDQKQAKEDNITPLRCLFGSIVAGALAVGLYFLMSSIVQTYATKPVLSTNMFAVKIASAVRTLVIGVAALGTGVFGFVAIGLFLLGIQITIKDISKRLSSN